MKVKIDKITHNVEGESPFIGTILHSNTKNACWGFEPNTKNACWGFEPKMLVRDIKKEGSEGIIFTGDWHNQTLGLLEILKESKVHNLKIMIYTDLTFQELQLEIGVASWEKTKKEKLNREYLDKDDAIILGIGVVMLEYYVGYQDYWIFAKDGDSKKLYTITNVEGD